jgi:replication factor A2
MDYQGGGGGDGGGGFGSSQQSAQKPRRSYDEQTLIPVTLHMAMKATPDASGDGSLILEDGRKLTTIKVVGAVRSFENASTNVLYVLEDGTGLMDIKQWLDDNDCTAIQEIRQQTLKENIYIKVTGSIKDYEGKKMLVASSVRPLTTANELTHHMLQVVHSAEKYKRADSIVSPGAAIMNNNGVGFGGGAVPVAQTTSGGNSLKERVLNFIKTCDDGTDAGCHIDQCVKGISDAPEAEIRKTMEQLAEDGDVYSTISEDHFKVAQ